MIAKHGIDVHDHALGRASQHNHNLVLCCHVAAAPGGLQHGAAPVEGKIFAVDGKDLRVVGALDFLCGCPLHRFNEVGRDAEMQIASLQLHHLRHCGR